MAKTPTATFALGVDFGTNTVRALIVDAATGREAATSVAAYPSGRDGVITHPKDPNLARQNPADYLTGFVKAVKAAVAAAKKTKGFDAKNIVGIGIDATGSTPIPVNRQGKPLACLPAFRRDPAAMAWLWKDHTAHAEAAEITDKARHEGLPYLRKCGGTYSSEWYWSKILHCRRTSPKVFSAAYSWVEQSDFVPAQITGNVDPAKMARNVCAAGHKAMYHPSWGGLPAKGFLASLAPELAELRDRYFPVAVPADAKAGELSPDYAKQVGLPAGIPVAVGIIDAHAGAVGAGVRPGVLVKVLGTSTCDMMVAPPPRYGEPDIPGLCGVVPGSIVPGMLGFEAGQSAVGDVFNWFVEHLTPHAYTAKGDVHANLSKEAAKLKPGESGLLALDWNNGNRCILVDPLLTGLLIGQTLHTTAPEVYRALVEATAFGALTIIRQFERHGLEVRQVVNCGGIAEKSSFVMQTYADVCNRPMKLAGSANTCALGAAIFGAVVGGAHRSVEEAQRKMTGLSKTEYRPHRHAAEAYARLFELYTDLHDAFGTGTQRDSLARVMKQLIAIRDAARR